ncbi:MAG TPA: hypothetical protein VFS00_01985, partial [Polyangiaceae bacterium]|nr:hypothetical protein [Polyangiaceae bacterium]
GQSNDVFAAALGFANYVAMVQPEKGAALRERVRELMAKHAYRPPPRQARGKRPAATAPAPGAPTAAPAPGAPPAAPGAKAPEPPDAPTDPNAPKKKWWKLF